MKVHGVSAHTAATEALTVHPGAVITRWVMRLSAQSGGMLTWVKRPCGFWSEEREPCVNFAFLSHSKVAWVEIFPFIFSQHLELVRWLLCVLYSPFFLCLFSLWKCILQMSRASCSRIYFISTSCTSLGWQMICLSVVTLQCYENMNP